MNFKVSALYYRGKIVGYRCSQPNGLFSDVSVNNASANIRNNVSERLELYPHKEDGTLRTKSEIEALKRGSLKSCFSFGSTWYYISDPRSEARANSVLSGIASRVYISTGVYPKFESTYNSLHSILTIKLNADDSASTACTEWLNRYKFEYTIGVTEDNKFLLTIKC